MQTRVDAHNKIHCGAKLEVGNVNSALSNRKVNYLVYLITLGLLCYVTVLHRAIFSAPALIFCVLVLM